MLYIKNTYANGPAKRLLEKLSLHHDIQPQLSGTDGENLRQCNETIVRDLNSMSCKETVLRTT